MSGRRSLSAQIEEVERELDKRRTDYPREVRASRMRQGVADEHVLRLSCVLETLRWLQVNESRIKSLLGKKED